MMGSATVEKTLWAVFVIAGSIYFAGVIARLVA